MLTYGEDPDWRERHLFVALSVEVCDCMPMTSFGTSASQLPCLTHLPCLNVNSATWSFKDRALLAEAQHLTVVTPLGLLTHDFLTASLPFIMTFEFTVSLPGTCVDYLTFSFCWPLPAPSFP